MPEVVSEPQPENGSAKPENGVQDEVKSPEKPAKTTKNVVESETPENDQSDAAATEEASAELLKKIQKQVEFYFGDVNMQRDKFLIEQTKLDEGWIPMSVMLNFKLLAALSKNIPTIIKALRDSELIEISEDDKKIRRKPDKPLPEYNEEYRKAQEAKTIYLKGFPLDSTMEGLKSHFEPQDVENIIMRKYKKGTEYFFKGSIFVQFKTVDDAKAFLEQESIKYNGTELTKMWAADYAIFKEKERDERRQKKMKDILKSEQTKQSKNQKGNQEKPKIPKGCVIHFSNVEKEIPREKIKEELVKLDAEVVYIDYNKGDKEGWIRLQGENSAVEILKKLDSSSITVEECELKCRLIEGDEEEAYFKKVLENMASHKQNRESKGRRRGFKRQSNSHREGREGNAKRQHLSDD
ncbi:hypothetical protein QAD02_001550 [Eretmocerus hayati]|uniref:Uncharacterized protein n=1 Tax=Eretmocerus hayati TaxID=131215 RepID=A0ACC2NH86_9HYME|nr:hypothetical protein QAD02_001550 [Eretmocerus hayati]